MDVICGNFEFIYAAEVFLEYIYTCIQKYIVEIHTSNIIIVKKSQSRC